MFIRLESLKNVQYGSINYYRIGSTCSQIPLRLSLLLWRSDRLHGSGFCVLLGLLLFLALRIVAFSHHVHLSLKRSPDTKPLFRYYRAGVVVSGLCAAIEPTVGNRGVLISFQSDAERGASGFPSLRVGAGVRGGVAIDTRENRVTPICTILAFSELTSAGGKIKSGSGMLSN